MTEDTTIESLTIHELTAELMEAIYRSGGRIRGPARRLLEEYRRRLPERLSRIAFLRALQRRLLKEAELVDEDIGRLKRRRDRLRKLAANAGSRCVVHMEDHFAITKERAVELPYRTRVRLVENACSVEGPEDVDAWPDELIVVERRPDKMKARRLLQAGRELKGVVLRRRGRHLRWS